jgi:hypothetical protein
MSAMTTVTASPDWMKWWTVFFFAWFIGFAPPMAIFVTRISRGRTIREMIIATAVLAPIVTTVWFTLLGGSGIFYELQGAIDLSQPLQNFEFDVATLTVAQALPGGAWMALAILVLTTIFVATTGDSMSYAVSVVCAGNDNPGSALRAGQRAAAVRGDPRRTGRAGADTDSVARAKGGLRDGESAGRAGRLTQRAGAALTPSPMPEKTTPPTESLRRGRCGLLGRHWLGGRPYTITRFRP